MCAGTTTIARWRHRGSAGTWPARLTSAAKWIAQRRAVRVDDCWWDELDVAVVDEDFPAGVVYVPMMRFTEQHAVLDAGFAIVDPVPRVVRLTHSRWPIAAAKS